MPIVSFLLILLIPGWQLLLCKDLMCGSLSLSFPVSYFVQKHPTLYFFPHKLLLIFIQNTEQKSEMLKICVKACILKFIYANVLLFSNTAFLWYCERTTVLSSEIFTKVKEGMKQYLRIGAKFTLILLTNYCKNGVPSYLCHFVSWKMDENKVMLGEVAQGLQYFMLAETGGGFHCKLKHVW